MADQPSDSPKKSSEQPAVLVTDRAPEPKGDSSSAQDDTRVSAREGLEPLLEFVRQMAAFQADMKASGGAPGLGSAERRSHGISELATLRVTKKTVGGFRIIRTPPASGDALPGGTGGDSPSGAATNVKPFPGPGGAGSSGSSKP